MADLETLTMTVETTAGESDDALKRVTENLKKMKSALEGIDTKGLSEVAQGMRKISQSADQTGIKKAASDIKKQVNSLTMLQKTLNGVKGFGAGGMKALKTGATGITSALKKLTDTFGLSAIASGKFVSSLARIAGYRAIRTIISSITKGAATGLENLAHASAEANATLSQLSSGALTLQNAMGGALYSVLASIIGVLNTIINAAVSAINWISMLFSILGGRATFKKATTSTKEYASALGGAAGGAKALKQELMGFDEINSLSPDTGGGGGGGGAGMLDYGSMFEEAPVSESLKEMVDKADFTLLGESLANKINSALRGIDWSKIKDGAYRVARSLVTFLNGFIRTIDATEIGEAISGVVNSGLTAINTFAYDTDWETLGNKVKSAIMVALHKISAQDIGKAFSAKLNIIITFLKGVVPKTAEEWSVITDWVAESIKASVNSVDARGLGEIIGRVITGALRMITTLGETGVITNIGNAVTTAIQSAVENISADDIKEAARTIIESALSALKILLNLVVEIGDTLPGKMITSFALFNVLKHMVSAAGITGYKGLGRTMALTGMISSLISLTVGIGELVEGVTSGSGVSGEKIAEIIGSAFEAVGFALLTKGQFAAGGITLGIGLLLKAFANVEVEAEAITLPSDILDGTYIELVNLQQTVEGLAGTFNHFAGMELPTDQVQELLSSFSGIDTTEIEGMRVALLSLFAAYKESTIGTEGKTIGEFLNAEGLGSYVTEAENASAATESLGEATAAISSASEGIATAAEGVASAQTDISELSTTMQATGEQAEALKTKIVEIPSEIVFNLELSNYDTVIEEFTTLQTTATEVAGSVKSAFTGINWFNIGKQISTAFKRGIKSVKMPTISVSWKTSTKTASFLGEEYTVSVPTPTIKLYAKGGFPDAGELFMANENGVQELVGRVGNKPAVANQDQIGDAIFKYMDAHEQESGGMDYNAMANALVGAMKTAGLGALYLDGKMLKSSLNKEAQRSGRPALGY